MKTGLIMVLAVAATWWLYAGPAAVSRTKALDAPDEARIASEVFARATYSGERNEMTLWFRNGSAYRYREVPRACYNRFMASARKGAFYNEHIRGRFACSPMEGEKPSD